MERLTVTEMIDAIKSNYPHSGYTMLREALDHALELMDAESNGRLVMLPPYGPGDTLFYTLGGEILELTVSSVDCVIRRDGRALIISAMFASGGETTFTEDNFGKTVFFTREEAEAALAAMEGQREI